MSDYRERQVDQDRLEGMVDRYGLYILCDMLAQVCHDKSDHLTTNWQDISAARHWGHAAKEVDKMQGRLTKIQLP